MRNKISSETFKHINRFLYGILTSGYADTVDLKQRSEIILFNTIVMVGIGLLIPLGIVRIAQGFITLGCIDFFAVFLFASLSIYHGTVKRIAVPRIGCATVIIFLFGYLAISTGHHNTGILWSYCLPAVMVFILNRKRGSLVIFSYLLIIVGCFMAPIFPCHKNYPSDFKFTFIFSFVSVWIVAYYFEYIMSSLHNKAVENNIQLKKTIRELSETKDQLFQAQKLEAIGRLAGGVAHDFNNILAAISGYAELIKHKYAADPMLMKYASSIFNSSVRAADLTAKLLAYARKGKIEVAAFDMHQIIDDVIDICEHTMDKKISIRRDLRALHSVIMGDRNQLQNALTNLAVNAEDAMPMGGILTFATETVDIGDAGAGGHAYLVAPGRYFKFSLSDTGMGMDAATLAKAFEPFFTTKDKGKGTGLGLSSVYGTIKSHNGYIELISEAGKGTRAEIHLPCTRNAELKPSERQRGILKGQGAILFVDDEEMVREMASEAIKELGYSVVTSSDGQDALNYYRSHAEEIDLTILDIIMPHMGGYECFKAMKAINPKLKVIVCSGYVINNEARKMLHQGAVGFIQKPFSMKTLEKALQTALQS